MIYRKQPSGARRYPQYSSEPSSKRDYNDDSGLIYSSERLEDIPLPNEPENTARSENSPSERKGLFFLDIFKDKIHIEEIILVGLIFFLLNEGIEDELLILLLIYILLF
jgi:hypothetical protein